MAIKRGKMVTYYQEASTHKVTQPFKTWSFKITWQIENVLSPLPQWLKPPKSAARWSRVSGFQRYSHMTIWISGYVRQRDNLKTLNLIYHKTSYYQTCQGGNLLREAPTLKVAWPLNHVVLWFFSLIRFVGLERKRQNRH